MEEISCCVVLYLYYIVIEVENCDLLIEFVLMLFIESDFDVSVYLYKYVLGLW